MTRYVYRPNDPHADQFGMVEAGIAAPKNVHNVISDHMEPTRHMVNSRYYTSKAKFRQATKDAGCIEVGNEIATLLKPRKIPQLDRRERREAIRQAIRQLQG